MVQKFGSQHTAEKLDRLEAYLKAYSTALKHQGFELTYFDAFAGAGGIQIAPDDGGLLRDVDDYSPFIEGSAVRALQLGGAFDRYIFVDKRKRNVAELNSLKNQHAGIRSRISICRGEANQVLTDFCKKLGPKARAVVFLDPFGNQVEWSTLEVIAATRAIDMWYLFPAGLGVHRQIGRDGSVHFTHGDALDRILGTPNWRTAFIRETEVRDLFEGSRVQNEKIASPGAITEFMISRMREVFRGGVLDEWVPLGSRKVHMYSLIFAWANTSQKARELATRLAKAVLKGGSGGRA